MSMLDHALAYAEQNVMVFPIHRPLIGKGGISCSCHKGAKCGNIGKHPATPNGLYAATTDVNNIKSLWSDSNYNIGIICGAKTFDVLDEDPNHGGTDTIKKLSYWFEPLPNTIKSITGSGGKHWLFKHTPGLKNNNSGKLGPGLDFKTTGGYIVAPPSLHKSGNYYRWAESAPLAELPGWLHEKLIGDDSIFKRIGGRDDEHWIRLSEPIGKDSRHNALISVAGKLLMDARIEPHLAVTLIKSYNKFNCVPPKDDEEIQKIIAWIIKKAGVTL